MYLRNYLQGTDSVNTLANKILERTKTIFFNAEAKEALTKQRGFVHCICTSPKYWRS